MISTFPSPRISAKSPKSGKTSVVVMVRVYSHMSIHNSWMCSNTLYAWHVYRMQFERFYSLKYWSGMVCRHVCRMQFETFYSLKHSEVAWFVLCTITSPRFLPILPDLGNCMSGQRCECKAICPSTAVECAQTPHICMTWMWDAVWKVLKPQP